MKLEEVKPGDVLVLTIGARSIDFVVRSVDHAAKVIHTSFGPVGFDKLPMLRRRPGHSYAPRY